MSCKKKNHFPFFFPLCLVSTSLCEPNPCLNGGVCVASQSGQQSFTCNCPFGFEGNLCQRSKYYRRDTNISELIIFVTVIIIIKMREFYSTE